METLAIIQQAADSIPGLAGLGVGGAIALIVLSFYRQDRKSSEEALQSLGKEFREVVENNTAAMTKLITLVEKR